MKVLPLNYIIARARHHIFRDLSGINISRKHGDGYDFSQIREYMAGDNCKRIDWKQSAKTQELQYRDFYEDKEVSIHILALMSGSLHFGIARKKQELLGEIIALLGLNTINNANLFSLVHFSQKTDYKLPLNKKESYVLNSVKKTLEHSVIGQHVDYELLSKYALYEIRKSSILFMVGDFLEIPDLKKLKQKHEVVAVIIRDTFEENPSKIGEISVKDPQNLKESEISFDGKFIKNYKEKQKIHDLELEDYFKKYRIPFVKIYTHEDPFFKLLNFLKAY